MINKMQEVKMWSECEWQGKVTTYSLWQKRLEKRVFETTEKQMENNINRLKHKVI
jgi:hypothetical protein